jgi:hypothetical protein
MEQQAGHAGMEGANPTAYPGGYPSYGSVRFPCGSSSSGSGQSAPAGSTGDSATSGKA